MNRLLTTMNEIKDKNWFPYLLLFLITALAAGLRFYKLGEWSFWIDEIYTINHAQAHFSSKELLLNHIPPARNWIPISIILTAQVINQLGVSEWSARLVSAVIGILTIPILFFPLRKIFGSSVTLIALLLLAVAPWHIFWSQNARFYTSLMLFYTLALAVFYFGMEKNRPWYFTFFWGFVYLAFSERLFAIFIFPVIACYLLTILVFRFERPIGFTLRNIILISVPMLFAGFIEIFHLIVESESRFFSDFGWFLLYRNADPIRLFGSISFNVGIPLMVIAAITGIALLINKNRIGLLLLSNAVVPTIILLALNPFIFTKDRYIFFTLISWLLLAAYGVTELFRNTGSGYKWLPLAVLLSLLIDAGSDDLLYYRVNHGNRGEWKSAFTTVSERIQGNDHVVSFWPEFGPYYLNREISPYESMDVNTIKISGDNYWFILDRETIWINLDLKFWLENNADLIDMYYLRTPEDFFIRIYYYSPK
jgi:mannosyltransferase